MQNLAAMLPMGLAPVRPDDTHNAKASRWRQDLDRRHAYLETVVRSESDRAALERAHAAEVAEGPPEARIRRGSTFARPSVGLRDRNALARLMTTFEVMARGTWRADHEAAKREGRTIRRTVARTCLPVLRALVALAQRHEHVHPSRARLASMAQCSVRTVDAALATLAVFGFITVTRRRKIEATPHGGRARQDTNGYTIHDPVERGGIGSIACRLFGKVFEGANRAHLSSHNPTPNQGRLIPVDPVKPKGGRASIWAPRLGER